jgi:pimeloyl-ACP methyl ester carboxylesterase
MGREHELGGWDEPTLFDVGGYRLALRQAGRRQPTVVLEMGLGAAGSFYDDIAERVSEFTRVTWYDHAGLGRSDPAPKPRTIADLAADLHALLHAAQIAAPYVLVGHSLGGLTVRYYQHQHPAEVAALVLIDSAHEEQRERLLAALPPEAAGGDPPEVARYRTALRSSWEDPTSNDEGIDNIANSALMRRCASLGDVPLVVVSRGQAQAHTGLPSELVARREQTWRQMQCELALLSSRSVHLIAESSGHLVNEEQPEMVVEAVRQAVALTQEHEDR